MLRRIPAVKWALTRLRPLPHSGSIDVAPIVADEQPAVIVEIANAALALETSISTEALHGAGNVVTEDHSNLSVIAESPSAAPSDSQVGDDPSDMALLDIESIVEAEASVSSDVDDEPAEIAELVIAADASSELPTHVEPVVANDAFVSPVEVETAPACFADSLAVPTSIELQTVLLSPVLVSPAPEIREAPNARARVADAIDRTTLIRQRWAETGIRMWNPRLHGTGDATLNIQGRVELLPPAPGENLPRYDKLEFKMLGGQIVCEGVIVEAPAHGDKRSFTRLAEPQTSGRVREPVRERQAALA
ncbi:hypothetical protein [Bradyrhizobium sp. RDM4]|uniref:hypothetical protein n=1 Tax=Bradyrhizobium sp. RDM4 TaxID=3378765 RepID=UPI0038FCE978